MTDTLRCVKHRATTKDNVGWMIGWLMIGSGVAMLIVGESWLLGKFV